MYIDATIGYELAGFRPDFSVMDHIFTLHVIIEYYKIKKGAFDHSKAFYLIGKASLWSKLLDNGVKGRIFYVAFIKYNKSKIICESNYKIFIFFLQFRRKPKRKSFSRSLCNSFERFPPNTGCNISRP